MTNINKKLDERNRGGLKLEPGTYGSPRWTYEVLDCAMPMTFDTYSNCAHQCLYCFSFFQRAIGEGSEEYLHHKVRAVSVERVIRMFTDPDKHAGQFKNYIKRRMTLQWGGLSDGFDFYERKFRKSLELLRFFNSIDYPLSISTKGVWWVYDDDYRKELEGRKNIHVKYSIITDNEKHVKELEPGVPTAQARFEAMRELNKLGIGATTLRFRPFVIGTSDLCIDSMFEKAKEVGCYSVTTEFLGWESRSSNTSRERLDRMSKTLGYDVWKFYLENSAHASGLLRLNYDLKRPYMKKMKAKAEELDLKFFVSDAHHKEDSYHAGCCGLPETGPLSNVNRGQYAYAIKIAKQKGFVQWKDISEEAFAVLGDIPFSGAEGFNTGGSTERLKHFNKSLFDFMHDIWNNPKSWQSPARYFGGALVPAQTDENGDIIYLYNDKFINHNEQPASVNELAIHLRMAGKPNADRYDEMVADGTDFAHVAYPVYVFSRKRWNNATTMKLLDEARVNYHLVVSQEDYQYYEEKYPNADILVLPEGTKGIRKARQFVYEACFEEGYPYVWMLDDDIAEVHRKGEGKVSLRALFSRMERFVEDYSNVALAGVGTDSGKLFDLNMPVEGLMLVNLRTGKDWNYNNSFSVDVYENVAFALQHLQTGDWVTLVHGEFKVFYAQLVGGGASNLYNKINAQLNDAKVIEASFPNYCNIEIMGAPLGGRLIVNWKAFTATIRSRHVEKLIKGE